MVLDMNGGDRPDRCRFNRRDQHARDFFFSVLLHAYIPSYSRRTFLILLRSAYEFVCRVQLHGYIISAAHSQLLSSAMLVM